MVMSYEGGTKSLPMFWFVSGFLSTSCGQRGRCVCVCVWVWVWGDGNGCVAGEKVTNARGNACLGKFFSFFFFFSPLCCRPEDREEIQTKITPVPLPEKCAPLLPPDILPAPRKRSQYGSWVELGMAGVAGASHAPCPPLGRRYSGQYLC